MGYVKTNSARSHMRPGDKCLILLCALAAAIYFFGKVVEWASSEEHTSAEFNLSSPNPQPCVSPLAVQSLIAKTDSDRVSQRQSGWHKTLIPGRYGSDRRYVLAHYILFGASGYGTTTLHYVPAWPGNKGFNVKYIRYCGAAENLYAHYLYQDGTACGGTYVPAVTSVVPDTARRWILDSEQPQDTWHVTNVSYTAACNEDDYHVPAHWDYFDGEQYVGSLLPDFDPNTSSSGREILEKVAKDHEHFQGFGHGYDWPAPKNL